MGISANESCSGKGSMLCSIDYPGCAKLIHRIQSSVNNTDVPVFTGVEDPETEAAFKHYNIL